MLEVIVLGFMLVMVGLWFIRILAEEAWAAMRGQTSPRIQRRRDREKLAAECGTPTALQAVSRRIAQRIEHPPDRQWAAALRALLTELALDAIEEQRVRHQHNHEARLRAARARREQRSRSHTAPGEAWQARTGSAARRPPEPAPAPVDALTTRPCARCSQVTVVEPATVCWDCETATPHPSDPDPPDVPTGDAPTPPHHEQEEATMPTHTISGDVRDPRTALNAATTMRGANNAIADEMDILLNNMRNVPLGQGLLDEIAALADEQRSYADSNAEQCRVYAAQVLAQQDIYDDGDLRDTVRGTYLDMQGGDLVTPPAGVPGSVAISAVDCHTPEAGAWFCDNAARAYRGMKVSVDQMRGNHEQQNCPEESIGFLNIQLDYATSIATKSAALRDRFHAHAAKFADTLDPNGLRGTQNGRYARAGG